MWSPAAISMKFKAGSPEDFNVVLVPEDLEQSVSFPQCYNVECLTSLQIIVIELEDYDLDS
jgi:hypothetical protein